jgi:predicted porin
MKKAVMGFLPAAVTALCVGMAAPALAVDVKAGNWDLSLTGNVNAFATYTRCGVGGPSGPNADVVISHACTKAEGAPNTFAIESGLLPSAFVFTAKTRAYDLDVSATIGLYPGLHVSDTRTGNASDGLFSMDVRQNFITVGDKGWGTIKLGKDLGLFGADAILSDMTLLGVGSGTGGAQLRNHNVTLGHIGTGYIYADWIPQFAYISPSFGGLQLTVAAVEAFKIAPADSNETPGVQAKVTYDFAGPYAGRVWAGGMYQNSKLSAPPTNPSLDTYAGELGVKANVMGLGAVAYGYIGKGLGTTLIGLASSPDAGPTPASATVNPDGTVTVTPASAGTIVGDSIRGRTSYGGYLQLTYQIPGTKLRPGVSWGMSYLNQAGNDADTLVHWNGQGTAALFYALTDTLTLVAEADHQRSRNWAGGTAKSNSFALGAIMFF